MHFRAVLTERANKAQTYKTIISSVGYSPQDHFRVENMDTYPSKRRKISPFTSILVTPSDAPKEPAYQPGEHAPRQTSFSSTQAKLTSLDPNEVHPPAPFTDSLQKQQNGSIPHTASKSFQESTNSSTFCENEDSSQPDLRYNTEAERLAACAELPDSSAIAASGRNGIVPESGMLRRPSPEANPHSFPEKYQAAIAEEPRASPPASDVDKASPSSQLEESSLKPVEQDQSAHVANGTSTVGQHVPEQEPSVGPEPQLPFTPTKQSIDVLEPRLPSTPSQLGLEPPPTPPKGLASAVSPRRLRKKRQIVHKSSPLKLGDLNSIDKTDKVPYVSNLGPRVPVVNIRRSAQMFTLNAEHFRLQMEKLGTGLSKHSGSIADAEVYNTEIFQQTPSLAERLALFLPFSRPVTSMQSLATPCINPPQDNLLDIGASQPPELKQAESLDYHLPPTSSMTVIDGPGNSLTQPSSMTVAESLDPSRLPDSSSQGLDITCTSHQQLLVVNIQLVVDKATGNSVKITIASISSWADSELGQWLRNEAQSLPRATIERAIRSYWETSLVRASCWRRCEEDIGATARTFEPMLNSSANKPESTSLKKTLPGKPVVFPPVAEFPRSPPENTAPAPPTKSFTSKPCHSLQPHLGRRYLLFHHPPVSLLVTWHITIAADGTNHNHISAHPAYPKRWMESTEQAQGQGEGQGHALGRIDEAFDALLVQRGVFESIKELCNRIFATT